MAKNSRKIYDVTVIGGGASGMMAAISAARAGAAVLLVEKKNRLGKKILATGNGKCNYTNLNMSLAYFHGNETLISNVLSSFNEKDTISFFQELGIYPMDKNGYVYPNSSQASSILLALEYGVSCENIDLRLECQVTDLDYIHKQNRYQLRIDNEMILSKAIVFSTGLLAAQKLGSDGSSFPLIKSLGHHFSPILPALCGFYGEGFPFKEVAGVRTNAAVALSIDESLVATDIGELQLTDYGVSGIPVFQISSPASKALYQKKKVSLSIDFLPNLSADMIQKEIMNLLIHRKKAITLAYAFNGLLPSKLISALCKQLKLQTDEIITEDNTSLIHRFIKEIKQTTITLTKARDFEFAQVCTGGIATEEIDMQTLESLYFPNIYFCGELLDVDGICGGYNLQWAWSSGYVAGKNSATLYHT